MKIAIFGTTELQTFPELADISRRHTVIPFLSESSGDLRDWQNELRHSTYDVLHFAGHIGHDERNQPVRLHLGDTVLAMEDVVSMAKLASAKGLFLNACDSAMIANYAIHNGVPCAIYTTADLPDRDAWKFPMLFYEQVARQEDEDTLIDLRKAFEQAVDRSGFYGWASNGLYERSLLSPLVDELGKVYDAMADHTERVNVNLSAYDAKMGTIAKQVQLLAYVGGAGIVANTFLLMAHYLNLQF